MVGFTKVTSDDPVFYNFCALIIGSTGIFSEEEIGQFNVKMSVDILGDAYTCMHTPTLVGHKANK